LAILIIQGMAGSLPMLVEPINGTLVTLELVQRPSGTIIRNRDLAAC
jgi:hypothetical protein